MKRLRIYMSVALGALFALQTMASIHSEEPITFENLPMKAKIFIEENFAHFTVMRASYNPQQPCHCYEVNLSDNTLILFDEIGQWTSLENQDSSVPAELIPSELKMEISKYAEGNDIQKLEQTEQGYLVVLANGKTLTFDLHCQLTDSAE